MAFAAGARKLAQLQKRSVAKQCPDTEAAAEVVARMWLAMRGALIIATEGEPQYEVNN